MSSPTTLEYRVFDFEYAETDPLTEVLAEPDADVDMILAVAGITRE